MVKSRKRARLHPDFSSERVTYWSLRGECPVAGGDPFRRIKPTLVVFVDLIKLANSSLTHWTCFFLRREALTNSVFYIWGHHRGTLHVSVGLHSRAQAQSVTFSTRALGCWLQKRKMGTFDIIFVITLKGRAGLKKVNCVFNYCLMGSRARLTGLSWWNDIQEFFVSLHIQSSIKSNPNIRIQWPMNAFLTTNRANIFISLRHPQHPSSWAAKGLNYSSGWKILLPLWSARGVAVKWTPQQPFWEGTPVDCCSSPKLVW